VDDSSPSEVQEEENEDFSEPDVIGLDEVTGPGHVVPEERRPAQSVAPGPRPVVVKKALEVMPPA
jgi:hypothetical protein